MKKEYTMIVRDRAGVLSRITAYVRRNGWNVESVHVDPIRGSEQSRMVMTIEFTPSESKRFEQCLHEWNFIFDIKEIATKDASRTRGERDE